MKSLCFPDSSLFGLENESVSDLITSDQISHDFLFKTDTNLGSVFFISTRMVYTSRYCNSIVIYKDCDLNKSVPAIIHRPQSPIKIMKGITGNRKNGSIVSMDSRYV